MFLIKIQRAYLSIVLSISRDWISKDFHEGMDQDVGWITRE
jgi:hypothetical protein